MAKIDPRTEDGKRIGIDRYCDHLERRIAELEWVLREIAEVADAGLADAKSSCRSEARAAAWAARQALRARCGWRHTRGGASAR